VDLQGKDLGFAALGGEAERLVLRIENLAHRHVEPAIVAENVNGHAVHQQPEADSAARRLERGGFVQAPKLLLVRIVNDGFAAQVEGDRSCIARGEFGFNVEEFAFRFGQRVDAGTERLRLHFDGLRAE